MVGIVGGSRTRLSLKCIPSWFGHYFRLRRIRKGGQRHAHQAGSALIRRVARLGARSAAGATELEAVLVEVGKALPHTVARGASWTNDILEDHEGDKKDEGGSDTEGRFHFYLQGGVLSGITE